MSYDNYLKNDLGLRTQDRSRRLKEHGLENFAVLSELDYGDVKTIFHSTRRELPTMIISALIEKRANLACYGARTYDVINRPVTSSSLNLKRLKQFELHKKIFDEHKDPTDKIPTVTKTFPIDKALDNLPNFLRSKIGAKGISLSYVVREEETPPALEPLANDLPYSEGSELLMNELISFTPHSGVG